MLFDSDKTAPEQFGRIFTVETAKDTRAMYASFQMIVISTLSKEYTANSNWNAHWHCSEETATNRTTPTEERKLN